MYKPARMGNGIEIWGIPEVLQNLKSKKTSNFLGMMGDAADNILDCQA
jgi:DNA polymerase-1